MIRNIDFFGPDGQKAVIFAASTRHGQRVELGLQVWNKKTFLWEKLLCTQLLPTDVVGISFELQRLCDKAQQAGFRLINQGKEVIA